jgi:hypothetical protein
VIAGQSMPKVDHGFLDEIVAQDGARKRTQEVPGKKLKGPKTRRHSRKNQPQLLPNVNTVGKSAKPSEGRQIQ